MAVEVCSYRLSLRSKPVGTYVLKTFVQGNTVHLESKMMLQGQLGQHTITQTSRAHNRNFYSFNFSEDAVSRSDKRKFDVQFDTRNGIVKASRGNNDRAEVPYIQAYRDPLSMLHELRYTPPSDDNSSLFIPMLGKDVTAQRLGETKLESFLGEHDSLAFLLHPGGSYVYVDKRAPHRIVRMVQRFDGQTLDVLLMKLDSEPIPDMKARTPSRPRRRKRRRRRSKSSS